MPVVTRWLHLQDSKHPLKIIKPELGQSHFSVSFWAAASGQSLDGHKLIPKSEKSWMNWHESIWPNIPSMGVMCPGTKRRTERIVEQDGNKVPFLEAGFAVVTSTFWAMCAWGAGTSQKTQVGRGQGAAFLVKVIKKVTSVQGHDLRIMVPCLDGLGQCQLDVVNGHVDTSQWLSSGCHAVPALRSAFGAAVSHREAHFSWAIGSVENCCIGVLVAVLLLSPDKVKGTVQPIFKSVACNILQQLAAFMEVAMLDITTSEVTLADVMLQSKQGNMRKMDSHAKRLLHAAVVSGKATEFQIIA
jgi:hypothetical protein